MLVCTKTCRPLDLCFELPCDQTCCACTLVEGNKQLPSLLKAMFESDVPSRIFLQWLLKGRGQLYVPSGWEKVQREQVSPAKAVKS